MNTNGPFLPDIGLLAEDLPRELSFYFSIGLILNFKNPYSVDVNVYFDDEPLIFDNRPAVDSQTISPAISNKGDFVSISTMLMNNVVVPSEGIYKIKTILYSGVVGETEREVLDDYDCFFIVSRDWKDIIMPNSRNNDGATG
ncbi:hypothetical protein [Serratia marcescens]|uniref:hypothetical protein n=1 Tax=Serratia marcescens TaxID=615 RepID=UPI000AC11CBA|nr:hypothetical protein [Serratia marcescens]MBN3986796.1 hypothetical protein [Serratia marcescens]